MTRLAIVALAYTAMLAFGWPAKAAPSPTPASIEAGVRQHGAQATIAALAKADQWDGVSDRMGTGDARWIALAPKLAPGSDAGSAEDLGISLAFSLPRNPRAVLAALDPANGHVLGAGRVCGMPFIEDTVKNRPAYKRHAIHAVRTVTDPRLSKARLACLRELERAS